MPFSSPLLGAKRAAAENDLDVTEEFVSSSSTDSEHTSIDTRTLDKSHEDVPMEHFNLSPANSVCGGKTEAAENEDNDHKANLNMKLLCENDGSVTVAAQCDTKHKATANANGALAIGHGDKLTTKRTASTFPSVCVQRLVEGSWPRTSMHLYNAIVFTGAILLGASDTTALQRLRSKSLWLVQLAIGRFQSVFDLELLRLASLSDWPHLGRLSALRCSSAGFYRGTAVGTMSSRDDVTCFSCGCTVAKWKAGTHPMVVHREKCFRRCRFVVEPPNSGNVAIGNSPIHLPSARSDEVPCAADCASSLGIRPLTPLAARALGAYTSAGLAAATCGASLVKRLSVSSRLWAVASSTPTARDDELTKHETYRLCTFADVWAYDHIVNAAELARNGFFYAGPGDRVQCAFCLGRLRNWKPKHRADGRHAKYFSYCRFVQGHDIGNVPIPFWPLLTANKASSENAPGMTVSRVLATGSADFPACQAQDERGPSTLGSIFALNYRHTTIIQPPASERAFNLTSSSSLAGSGFRSASVSADYAVHQQAQDERGPSTLGTSPALDHLEVHTRTDSRETSNLTSNDPFQSGF